MRTLLLSLLAIVLLGAPAWAQPEPIPLDLAGGALVAVEAEAIHRNPDLSRLLADLAAKAGALPRIDEAFQVAGTAEILVVPLTRAADLEAHLFLYYLPERREPFFLRIGTDFLGSPEVRLWGLGPSEIVISQLGAVLQSAPSEVTFRLDGTDRLALGDGLEALPEPVSIQDALSCIARTLGLGLNTTSLSALLSTSACTAASTMVLVMTAFSCLNPTPVGVVACTLGIAKMIACSIANCGNLPPTSCQGNIALPQRISATWRSECPAAHRAGRYARYYTFTLNAATRVRIDLEALLTDPYMILLRGAGPSGTVIATDDDSGLAWSSRIVRSLDAGTYTIEATTYDRGRTGSFTLNLSRP